MFFCVVGMNLNIERGIAAQLTKGRGKVIHVRFVFVLLGVCCIVHLLNIIDLTF